MPPAPETAKNFSVNDRDHIARTDRDLNYRLKRRDCTYAEDPDKGERALIQINAASLKSYYPSRHNMVISGETITTFRTVTTAGVIGLMLTGR